MHYQTSKKEVLFCSSHQEDREEQLATGVIREIYFQMAGTMLLVFLRFQMIWDANQSAEEKGIVIGLERPA